MIKIEVEYTPEEIKKIEELKAQLNNSNIKIELPAGIVAGSDEAKIFEYSERLKQAEPIEEQISAVVMGAELRYLETKTTEEIFEDARAIVDSIEPAEFREHLKRIKSISNAETIEAHPELYTDTAENFMHFCLVACRLQINKGEEVRLQIVDYVEQKGAELYPAAEFKNIDNVLFPLDAPNKNVWNSIRYDQASGQFQFDFDTLGNNKPGVYIAINFNELTAQGVKLSKSLSPYEKRVYIIASSLYSYGNQMFTARHVAIILHGTKKPSDRQVQNVSDAIKKLRFTNIMINNEAEREAGAKYERFIYDGYLLPAVTVKNVRLNGKLTDEAIKVLEMPPLIRFAKERRNITTLNARILDTPGTKNNSQIEIDDYLISIIAPAKNKNLDRTEVKFETIETELKPDLSHGAERFYKKIRETLKHFVNTGYILTFKEKKDRFEMLLK